MHCSALKRHGRVTETFGVITVEFCRCFLNDIYYYLIILYTKRRKGEKMSREGEGESGRERESERKRELR